MWNHYGWTRATLHADTKSHIQMNQRVSFILNNQP